MFRLLADTAEGFQTVVVTPHILPPTVRKEWSVTAIGAADYDTLIEPVPTPNELQAMAGARLIRR